jgi:ubiquitin-protein ligase
MAAAGAVGEDMTVRRHVFPGRSRVLKEFDWMLSEEREGFSAPPGWTVLSRGGSSLEEGGEEVVVGLDDIGVSSTAAWAAADDAKLRVRLDVELSRLIWERRDALSLPELELVFEGQPGTLYEGGDFYVTCTIPWEFPFKAPVFRFKTRVYHPDIVADEDSSFGLGFVCHSDLLDEFSPQLRLVHFLRVIAGMLETPTDLRDPENYEATELLRRDPEEFERTAREWTERFAGSQFTKSSRKR